MLAGGPTPDMNGQIMTYMLVRSWQLHAHPFLTIYLSYRSHFGKTKDNRTFEKFLGPGEYDDHLLRPFEKFLNESFSKYSYGNLVTGV